MLVCWSVCQIFDSIWNYTMAELFFGWVAPEKAFAFVSGTEKNKLKRWQWESWIPSFFFPDATWEYHSLAHTIHVWYIYLHLVDCYGKCRYIHHTWMVCGRDPGSPSENGFMELKYVAFWRWWRTPRNIILWRSVSQDPKGYSCLLLTTIG